MGSALVAVVAVAAAGAGIAALLIAPASPSSLAPPEPITDAPVGTEPFDDARSVPVRFTLGGGTSVTSPGDGRVTGFSCAAGGTIASGEGTLSIDGLPVLTLATDVPLWRDLVEKDRGDDVSALQRELARLGEPVTVDGVLGPETLDALERRFRALGDRTALDDGVAASRILWIPAPSVVVDECTLGTGSPTAAGEPLASLVAGVASAAITESPGDLVPGGRVLVVDGERLPVDADGAVRDAASLATLTATASIREAVQGEATSITASLELAEPVDIAVVPPSSVTGVDGTTGCVVADGAALPVDIVGSRLGQSLVRFRDGAAPSTVVIAPPESTTCG